MSSAVTSRQTAKRSALLSERGAGLDWEKTDLTELHSACHAARAESDLEGLIAMFPKILDTAPAYDF